MTVTTTTRPTVDPPPPTSADRPRQPPTPTAADLVEEDLLVEDVSIDGMCGVY